MALKTNLNIFSTRSFVKLTKTPKLNPIPKPPHLPPFHFVPSLKNIPSRIYIPDGNKSQNQHKIGKKYYSLLTFSFLVMGFVFLSMPLYRILCQSLGWDGSVSNDRSKALKLIKESQKQPPKDQPVPDLKVSFHCRSSCDKLHFTASQDFVWMTPGESALAFFTIENRSDGDVIGIATYTVHPYWAAPFFTKIQCFCFEEQLFRAREKIDMPILFFVDPAIFRSRRSHCFRHLTVYYRMYDRTEYYKNEMGQEDEE